MAQPDFVPTYDEIDLREILLVLWQGKWVVVGLALLTGAVTLLVNLALSRQYQAEALILIRSPKLQIEELPFETPDLQTVQKLVQSPAMLQILVEDDEVQDVWASEETLSTVSTLADMTNVPWAGKDGIQLSVTDVDPGRAALIASRWAALSVDAINRQYGWLAVVQSLERQVGAANESCQLAEKDYLQTLRKSRADALKAQLNSTQAQLGCVLSRQNQFETLRQDLTGFVAYLQALPADGRLMSGDLFALSALQQRARANKGCIADASSIHHVMHG